MNTVNAPMWAVGTAQPMECCTPILDVLSPSTPTAITHKKESLFILLTAESVLSTTIIHIFYHQALTKRLGCFIFLRPKFMGTECQRCNSKVPFIPALPPKMCVRKIWA